MARHHLDHIVVIGAGAAGLMTARELARAGRKVTVLEARETGAAGASIRFRPASAALVQFNRSDLRKGTSRLRKKYRGSAAIVIPLFC